MTADDVPTIRSLAGVIAVYGVYALVVLAVYQTRAAYLAYERATSDTRAHCASVHWVFIAATLVGSAAAGTIWYQTTVRAKPMIEGYVTGLIGQGLGGVQPRVGAITQTIEPVALQERFYEAQPKLDFSTGAKSFGWVILPDEPVSSLDFQLRQVWKKPRDPASLSQPAGTAAAVGSADVSEIVREKAFRLYLDSLPALRKSVIRLRYAPPAAAFVGDSIGKLHVQMNGKEWTLASMDPMVATRTVSEHRGRRPGIFRNLLVGVAYAQAAARAVVRRVEPPIDSTTASRLVHALQGDDAGNQATAVDWLVQQGRRSCAFVASALSPATLRTASEKGVLVHNLVHVVRKLEIKDAGACSEAYLPLALAYYDIGDYRASAEYFDKVPDRELNDPLWLYYRGYAYYLAGGRNERAARSLSAYLATSPAASAQMTAYTMLGRTYYRMGRPDDAARHYTAALRLASRGKTPNPQAANDLAYLYADRFAGNRDTLVAALRWADYALALAPKDADVLDTKGWVLFRLGRCTEASAYLTEARTLKPQSPGIERHAAAVRQSAGSAACRPGSGVG